MLSYPGCSHVPTFRDIDDDVPKLLAFFSSISLKQGDNLFRNHWVNIPHNKRISNKGRMVTWRVRYPTNGGYQKNAIGYF